MLDHHRHASETPYMGHHRHASETPYLADRWRANDGPLIVVFRSSRLYSRQFKRKVKVGLPPPP